MNDNEREALRNKIKERNKKIREDGKKRQEEVARNQTPEPYKAPSLFEPPEKIDTPYDFLRGVLTDTVDQPKDFAGRLMPKRNPIFDEQTFDPSQVSRTSLNIPPQSGRQNAPVELPLPTGLKALGTAVQKGRENPFAVITPLGNAVKYGVRALQKRPSGEVVDPLNVFSEMGQGFIDDTEGKPLRGLELLYGSKEKAEEIRKNNPILAGIIELGVDVGTDPTMLIGGGAIGAGKSLLAKLAEKALPKLAPKLAGRATEFLAGQATKKEADILRKELQYLAKKPGVNLKETLGNLAGREGLYSGTASKFKGEMADEFAKEAVARDLVRQSQENIARTGASTIPRVPPVKTDFYGINAGAMGKPLGAIGRTIDELQPNMALPAPKEPSGLITQRPPNDFYASPTGAVVRNLDELNPQLSLPAPQPPNLINMIREVTNTPLMSEVYGAVKGTKELPHRGYTAGKTPGQVIKPVEEVNPQIMTDAYNAAKGTKELPFQEYRAAKQEIATLQTQIKEMDAARKSGIKINLRLFGELQNKLQNKLKELEGINAGKYTRIERQNAELASKNAAQTAKYPTPADMPDTMGKIVSSWFKENLTPKQIASRTYTYFVDNLHPIKLIDEAVHKVAMISRNASGTVENILQRMNVGMSGNVLGESFGNIYRDIGKLKIKPQTLDGKTEVFDVVSEKMRKLTKDDVINDYMLHRRNVNSMSLKDTSIQKSIDVDLERLRNIRTEIEKSDLQAINKRRKLKEVDDKIKLIESKRGISKTVEKPLFEGYTAEMSAAKAKEYERLYPELKGIADRLNKNYEAFMREWAVKSGLLSDEAYQKMLDMYYNYVPAYRYFTELEKMTPKGISGKSLVNKTGLFPKAKGSYKPIISPLEGIVVNIDKIVRAARGNEAGQALVNSLRETPEKFMNKNGSMKAELIEPSKEMLDEINQILATDGVEGLAESISKQFDKTFSKQGSNVIKVMENGAPTFVKINDASLLEALKGIQHTKVGGIETAARTLSQPFKTVTTGINPVFGTQNLARDAFTGYINSVINNPATYTKDLGKAAVEAAKGMTGAGKSVMWDEFLAMGGLNSSFFKNTNMSKSLKNQTKKMTYGKNAFDVTGDVLGGYNQYTEALNRFAEYVRTVEKGGGTYQSKLDGLYNANEITVNFARHGDVTKMIDAFVPYLNPAVQGLDKTARQMLSQPGRSALKSLARTTIKGLGSIGLVTAVNTAVNSGNPDYEKLNNTVKDSYYLWPTGDGKFIKIAKSRENGVLYGSLLERINRYVKGDEGAFDDFGETIKTNFLPPSPATSNIFSPIFTNIPANKDVFGRNIEPQNMLGLSKKNIYDERTSKISKLIAPLTSYLKPLSEKFELSPKQMDYLLSSYTGIIGKIIIPATANEPNWGKAIGGGFTADVAYNNQGVQNFYEGKNKLQTQAKDFNKENNLPSDMVTPYETIYNEINKRGETLNVFRQAIENETDPEAQRQLRMRMNDYAESLSKLIKSVE